MKKVIFIVLILLLGLSVFPKEKEIRVRVIPNSNQEEDLKYKEEVKNTVLDYLENLDYSSYDELDKALEKDLDKIQSLFSQDIKVSYGLHDFPSKVVNGHLFKPEKVKTLLIVIEEGVGDNWWGCLYPGNLSIESDKKVEYQFFIEKILKGDFDGD